MRRLRQRTARLHTVAGGEQMLCVSGKLSRLGVSGVRHRSSKVLKNGNAGIPSTLESTVKTDPSGLKNVESSEFHTPGGAARAGAAFSTSRKVGFSTLLL
jgi:hypothetical protein